MPNRREALHEYYRRQAATSLLERAAAASIAYPFRGPALEHAVVTRIDLNGYSAWARDESAVSRAAQLDAFFSAVVPQIEVAGGVFFRDEGDCIVALFSSYFKRPATYDSIEAFCMTASAVEYGPAKLTAKSLIACGDVAFFQKKHEIESGDWSAEGEPFVRAARLEAAIESTKQVVMFADDYDQHFRNSTNVAAPGASAPWVVEQDSLQVQGLGLSGGWTDVVRLKWNR